MTALAIIGIVFSVLSFATVVAVTVLVSRALSSAFQTVNSMHERFARHQDRTLDRLMAVKWEDYVQLRELQVPDTQEGGFIPPEEQVEEGEMAIEPPGGWGYLNNLRDRLAVTEEEEEFLREDFPEEVSNS